MILSWIQMLIGFENALVELGGVVRLYVNFILLLGVPQSKTRRRKISLIRVKSRIKNWGML